MRHFAIKRKDKNLRKKRQDKLKQKMQDRIDWKNTQDRDYN